MKTTIPPGKFEKIDTTTDHYKEYLKWLTQLAAGHKRLKELKKKIAAYQLENLKP